MGFRLRLGALWILSWSVPLGAQATLALRYESAGVLESPALLFWLVVFAATACVILAMALLRRAFATNTAELGFLGLFYMSVSVLPLVHGITTPGILYDENTATMAAALWAIPVGLVVASPMFGGRRTTVFRRWKIWVGGSLAFIGATAAILLTEPEMIPSFAPGSYAGVLVAAVSISGCIGLSYRHYRLAQIAKSSAPLAVSMGYGLVGASAAMWLGSAPFSIGFWAAHLFDIAGVLSGLAAAIVVYRRSESTRRVLAPIIAVEPVAALEVGLEPIVHEFIGQLQAKDPITRDHVVRTSELAIAVAEELGMNSESMRRAGLAGLLHDIGKLEIPDAILTKPDRLTAQEYEVIKGHASAGADMVAKTLTISDIAAAIRSHHERVDGTGYPDQLRGDQVCLEARIVSVCDSFDAMVNTRQYRQGMGRSKAIAILREHSGSQWDEQVVEALIRVVQTQPEAAKGRLLANELPIGCDCLPAEADAALSTSR